MIAFRKKNLFPSAQSGLIPIQRVKWFNTTKGYGFIQPDNGGADVFVHISAVEKAGLRTLNENEMVSYDLVTEKGKTSAGNLAKA